VLQGHTIRGGGEQSVRSDRTIRISRGISGGSVGNFRRSELEC
jgi:hypothetical protein